MNPEVSSQESEVKLLGHPVKTGQARWGFPGKKYCLNCAPSCLPVGRDPAYKAGLAGHLPARIKK
jgi:hypothetical protein